MRFKKLEIFILSIIVIFGAFLRFYNLNWDEFHYFHPDERNIANAVSKINFFKDLNPGFFAYGGLPIYLYRAGGELMTYITVDKSWVSGWGHIDVVGRFFSALFSTLTIIALFFLGKKVFNIKVAILSSLLLAFTVSSIQTAHFAVTESLLTFLLVLLALFSIELLEKGSLSNYLKCAFIMGIALATKTTALSFLIFPCTAYLLTIIRNKRLFLKSTLFLFIFLLTSLAIFALLSPYTLLSWNKFMESMHYELGVARGTLPVPYILQFTKTMPYIFQIDNFFWQIGLGFIFIILAIPIIIVYFLKTKDLKILLILSFPLFYFLYIGSWHTKFVRYMVPIIPFIILYISFGITFLSKIRYGRFLIFFVTAITIFWGLAFFSIYTREQTRISASKWVYENIATGSRILTEHWDDGLPVPLPDTETKQYGIEQLTIYEPDNQTKITYFANKLAGADYIILNSRRLYGTLMYLPEKYPITSKYYKKLFSGELGYQKAAEFTSYPSLLGLEINDDSSEESFQVYDHPKVTIFKNLNRLSEKEISQRL